MMFLNVRIRTHTGWLYRSCTHCSALHLFSGSYLELVYKMSMGKALNRLFLLSPTNPGRRAEWLPLTIIILLLHFRCRWCHVAHQSVGNEAFQRSKRTGGRTAAQVVKSKGSAQSPKFNFRPTYLFTRWFVESKADYNLKQNSQQSYWHDSVLICCTNQCPSSCSVCY